MQQAYYRNLSQRGRGAAFGAGFILALIAGLIIFGIGFWTGFHNITFNSMLIPLALIVAFIGAPFLAGLIGTLSSGRIDTGIAAGVWEGLFVGIFVEIYLFIWLQSNAPLQISPEVIKQIQDQLAQGGIQISIQSLQIGSTQPLVYPNMLMADLLLLAIWIGLGTPIAFIGALIGKIFAPNTPKYIRPARY